MRPVERTKWTRLFAALRKTGNWFISTDVRRNDVFEEGPRSTDRMFRTFTRTKIPSVEKSSWKTLGKDQPKLCLDFLFCFFFFWTAIIPFRLSPELSNFVSWCELTKLLNYFPSQKKKKMTCNPKNLEPLTAIVMIH